MILNQVGRLKDYSLLRGLNKKKQEHTGKPLLVFCFDDGMESDYTIAYPLMQSLGIKGTSYLITSFIGSPGRLTWEQIKEMKAGGWDFQCHTHRHADLSVSTEEEIRYELESVNNAFISNGLEPPQHHAYTRGLRNELSTNIVSEYRLTQRNTGINKLHLNDYANIDAHYLKAVSVDTQDNERLDLVKSTMNYAYNNNMIMVSYCHTIIPEYDGNQYQIIQSYFEEILNHIKTIGIETLTISEMYDRVLVSN